MANIFTFQLSQFPLSFVALMLLNNETFILVGEENHLAVARNKHSQVIAHFIRKVNLVRRQSVLVSIGIKVDIENCYLLDFSSQTSSVAM